MTTLVPPGSVVDTTGDSRWTPVRVTAVMSDPIVNFASHGVHLDGAAAWGAYLAYQTAGHRQLPPMREWAHDFALPLATWTAPCTRSDPDPRLLAADGQVWGWACSAAYAPVSASSIVSVRRRPETGIMSRYTADNKHHLSTGPLKARDVPHPATVAPRVMWWALADPDALQTLLGRVHGIGRMPRHGHGRVIEWVVEPDDDAHTRWRERTMPHPGGTPDTVRAPYHHESRRMPCSSTRPA